MLNQKSDRFPDSARGHVGGVAEEDGAVVFAQREQVAIWPHILNFVSRKRFFSLQDLKKYRNG